MSIFKSTPHIFSKSWEFSKAQDSVRTTMLPQTDKWDKKYPIEISDVELWEEIHHQPGNFGVYAAWRPYADLFIVVHYLFKDKDYGIEIYRNEIDVKARSRQLGVGVEEKEIYIPSQP